MDSKNKKYVPMDGNTATAYIGYLLSDISYIYPITPSTPMGELCDVWSVNNKKNIFNNVVKIVEMQSEGGVAGAIHGAAAAGALATTYTSSQGLLLMIPNMYKIAGECLPVVFHVAARSIAAQALSIFGDHQDVMACRQTGFCMLSSNNPQEAMDMALIAHVAAVKSSLPFLHFFDGFRTSHEINNVEQIPLDIIKSMIPIDKLNEFRTKAHNPNHPKVTGTSQNDDTYFQSREANNVLYKNVYDIVKQSMDELGKKTNRYYQPFEYYGAIDTTDVIVVMGSGADTIQETIEWSNKNRNTKYGLIKVRLYRPFNAKAFVESLPKTIKRICVLDRTKEPGSIGEPLYLDVALSLNIYNKQNIKLIGGRFGLSSKDFNPTHVIEIFNNLTSPNPKNHFTVGINEDVTNTSLPSLDQPIILTNNYYECKFWGLGSDGTVSANKSSIKIIGETTNKFVQGYFEYDSKKSGGLTISHLRISDNYIRSPYYVSNANFIAIHKFTYTEKYDILCDLKKNGIVLLNTIYSQNELGQHLSENFKNKLKEQNAKLFIIDANKVASEVGLKNKISIIMQSCFFKINNIINFDNAKKAMIDMLTKTYASKGDNVIFANIKAIDSAIDNIHEVNINEICKQKYIPIKYISKNATQFYQEFCNYINHHKGNDIPVSKFNVDGNVPTGTAQYEKRNIATTNPKWIPENCIQCGQCTFVCPHAAIRAGVIKTSDLVNIPESFKHKSTIGIKGTEYIIQVSPRDCTGCGSCANVCMAKNKALVMEPIEKNIKDNDINWEYLNSLNLISDTIFKPNTVKGLQFKKPYFEFSGACGGCGETPYIKCITQLYGDKMVIANATGCSSIYGAATPTIPYTKDENGCGPSWSNSLFEDNAEYGYGIALGLKQRRNSLYDYLNDLLSQNISKEFKDAINEMIIHKEDDNSKQYIDNLINVIKKENIKEYVQNIIPNIDQLSKKSIWIIGGDGWAYDIGFGGLDHVLASGENVNILVLDTEVYSNTGGQASKASPMGAVAKFTTNGKTTRKKDLGSIAMTYHNVYVAQVAMGANPAQFLKAITEAEAYNGVSLIIAYAPCINHGINMSNSQLEEKKAVASGYWQLYRYNPAIEKKFTLDSPDPTMDYIDFLKGENRYSQLIKKDPSRAQKLFEDSKNNALEKLYDLKNIQNNE